MADSFRAGVFEYETFMSDRELAGAVGKPNALVRIKLDLNHPAVRALIYKATRNKNNRTSIVSGALTVTLS